MRDERLEGEGSEDHCLKDVIYQCAARDPVEFQGGFALTTEKGGIFPSISTGVWCMAHWKVLETLDGWKEAKNS